MSDQIQKSNNEKLSTEVKSPIATDNNTEDTCVVCFKNFDIYSIGECDHPVCYECSTRMRVLCQQNECPICRQVLSKVIFTKEKLPYRELERKNRSEFYNKRYKIGFSNFHIQQSFYELLDHACPKCNAPPYRTFLGLKNHVRKEHDLHYCDLCTEHLKIFTFERRCYTQADLGLHRTKGDPDNRSHRGHPLCEYCNKRYLDRDELFRHLRREHYFCHFCEADGVNEFYRDYAALADHFRQDHYLCEEGKCATEQFIGAFRTDIDYKAHIAKDHAKTLNKQQAKQTRTLQLEITLGRRGRQADQNVASVRSRGNEQEEEVIDEPTTSQQNQRTITIDAQNEEDFPSLGGATAVANLSLTRPPPSSMRMRSATAGLARTKENFPALGASDGGTVSQQREQNQSTSISKVLKNSTTSNAGANTRTAPAAVNINSGMVIHVSNRPMQNAANGPNSKNANKFDFPALPEVASKKSTRGIYEDLIPANDALARNSTPASRRMLADDYVSVANPCTSKKLQLVQKQEKQNKANLEMQKTAAPKLTNLDFPALSDNNSKSSTGANSWVKTTNDKKQRELENRKSKVAPAPILPTNKTVNKQINNNALLNDLTKKDKDKKDKDKKSKEKKSVTETNAKANGKPKEKNNNENKNTDNLLFSTTELTDALNGITNSEQTVRPPPGFCAQPAALKPPPGFLSQVTVNSVAKSPNDLTFTSSLGEKYSIMKTHTYAQPIEAANRNQRLIALFKEALKTRESFDEFHHISQLFREGMYKASAYYEHCQAALKDKFDHIFPELLALLPDISKQQALYLVHSQRLNSLPVNERKSMTKLEVCTICKQVLLKSDAAAHNNMHELKMNFPTLNTKSTKSTTPRK